MLYLAAVLIVLGVALFVAEPLVRGARERGRRSGAGRRSVFEHERGLALQGLRELEFDRQMNKLSEGDAALLRQALEARALGAMSAIEKLQDEQRGPALSLAPRRPRGERVAARPARVRFCPGCGAPASIGAAFCAECGTRLILREQAS